MRALDDIAKKTVKRYYEDILVLLFFIILAYLYLGANIFGSEIVAPMDLLLHYPGWKGTGIDIPIFNLERSDILDLFLPVWNLERNLILSGELPLWNHLRNGGVPCLTFYPQSYLCAGFLMFLVFGGGLGFSLALLIKLVIAGLGTYKLCRTELGILPSIFGGITYMMCGFNASWLMGVGLETSMWIPWVLWAIFLLERERTKERFILLSLIVALLIFGSFPFTAFSGLLLGCLLVLWVMFLKVMKEDKIIAFKSGLLLILSLGAGILIASVQILPFIEWVMQFDTSWRQAGTLFSITDLNILWNPFVYTHNFSGHIVPQTERYGYVGKITILFSFIAALSIFNKKIKLTQLSPLFWIFIFLIVSIPVFNVAPLSRIIYELPIFNINNSSRLLVILGLSLSILGAYGMEVLLKTINLKFKRILKNPRKYRKTSQKYINDGTERGVNQNPLKIESYNKISFKKIIIIVFIIIIGIHTFDMASVGKSMNSVVPKEAFYPDTPTILYVQKHIMPGQSVLATSDFLISGTLTFYNIPEWFAHGYLKTSEKEILSELVAHPWRTATAAMFDYNQINLNSSYMDKLGIRYILASKPSFVSQTRNDAPSPSMPSNKLGQSFNLREPINVERIDLLMATYGKINAEGYIVVLTLYDDGKRTIAKTQVNGMKILDNSWVSFKFDNPIRLNPGKYIFEVEAKGTKTSLTPITIWGSMKVDNFNDGAMMVNGDSKNGDLAFKIFVDPINGELEYSKWSKWNIFTLEDNIYIFENKNCPPGAYIIYDHDKDNMHHSADAIKILEFDSRTRKYLVKSNYSGLFVTTSRFWPGWKAYCNEKTTDIISHLGILQAVRIEKGISIIKFTYTPYIFYIGLMTSFIAIFMILIIPKNSRLFE